jgi:F-type H+-transporting ATPase subunit delta
MSVVARRYAKALMNLAARDNQIDAIAAGLDQIGEALASDARLGAFLAEPKVPQSSKEAVLAEWLEGSGAPALLTTYVRYLTRKRRNALLEDIRQVFHDLADERMGRAKADVTVAAPLTAEQEQRLQARLETLSGKQVQLRLHVDASILGGVVARIGSTVWDGSLRNQLNGIQQSILQG